MVNSLFDVIGPIMVGPSSSHTAGANKIALIASRFVGKEIKKVIFNLHGSFSETYRGHGSDKALLGGIMGYASESEFLRISYEIADENGLEYEFRHVDMGDVHPNSVELIITDIDGDETTIVGKSIGGGAVRIVKVNGISVDFGGDYPTLITHHIDRRGILAEITGFIATRNHNIATVNLGRNARGKDAFMIVECDEYIDPSIKQELIDSIKGLHNVYIINMSE